MIFSQITQVFFFQMDCRFLCLILVIVTSSHGDVNDLEIKEVKFNNLTNEPQIHNELDILSDFSIQSKYHSVYNRKKIYFNNFLKYTLMCI